jgi:Protein of unknown function (DUF2442)
MPGPPEGLDIPADLEPRPRMAPMDRAIEANACDGYLWITLADHRKLGTPLSQFRTLVGNEPRTLADVGPGYLERIELLDDGEVLYLPDLDEYISVPALLGYPD